MKPLFTAKTPKTGYSTYSITLFGILAGTLTRHFRPLQPRSPKCISCAGLRFHRLAEEFFRIPGAVGAKHLAGAVAAHTLLPVIGIPVEGGAFNGMDALLSTVQMPGGIPVGTLAIGKAGAINAGLLAAAILATGDADLTERLKAWRAAQTDSVALDPAAGAAA